MSEQSLTSLATIPAFTPPVCESLARYWLTSAEEFITTATLSNPRYGTGLAAIAEALTLSLDQVQVLQTAAQNAIPGGLPFDILPEITLATGAILDNADLDVDESFDLPIDLPTSVWLGDCLPPALNQGRRSTCVAFTIAAMYQQLIGNPIDLSEQFIYWACKANDGIPQVRGTTPQAGMLVMRNMGVSTEGLWPYNTTPIVGNEGQGPPPDEEAVLEDAQQRRIYGYKQLPPRLIAALKGRLAEGYALLIGFPVSSFLANGWQARALGKIRMALPGEADGDLGGHALCVLGYRDDEKAPGGGYFIARNSWGVSWGYENSDAAGYAHIPYTLIASANLMAYSFDGVSGI